MLMHFPVPIPAITHGLWHWTSSDIEEPQYSSSRQQCRSRAEHAGTDFIDGFLALILS